MGFELIVTGQGSRGGGEQLDDMVHPMFAGWEEGQLHAWDNLPPVGK